MSLKRVLIPWSGGFDSTCLILHYLDKGYEVNTCYFNIINNINKAGMELDAREKLFPILRDYKSKGFFSDLGISLSVDVKSSEGLLDLHQMPIWIYGLIASGARYDEIAIAYVMNDDAISYIHDCKYIFNSFKRLRSQVIPKKWPNLKFPFSKWSKKDLLYHLTYNNKDMLKILDHIWYCEHPVQDKPCGKCVACSTYEYFIGSTLAKNTKKNYDTIESYGILSNGTVLDSDEDETADI